MPDHGFRKTRRRKAGIVRLGRTVPGQRRADACLQEESRSEEVRKDVVARAQDKLAMGIYDDPLILDRAIEAMIATMPS
jgi:hypothetical protein